MSRLRARLLLWVWLFSIVVLAGEARGQGKSPTPLQRLYRHYETLESLTFPFSLTVQQPDWLFRWSPELSVKGERVVEGEGTWARPFRVNLLLRGTEGGLPVQWLGEGETVIRHSNREQVAEKIRTTTALLHLFPFPLLPRDPLMASSDEGHDTVEGASATMVKVRALGTEFRLWIGDADELLRKVEYLSPADESVVEIVYSDYTILPDPSGARSPFPLKITGWRNRAPLFTATIRSPKVNLTPRQLSFRRVGSSRGKGGAALFLAILAVGAILGGIVAVRRGVLKFRESLSVLMLDDERRYLSAALLNLEIPYEEATLEGLLRPIRSHGPSLLAIGPGAFPSAGELQNAVRRFVLGGGRVLILEQEERDLRKLWFQARMAEIGEGPLQVIHPRMFSGVPTRFGKIANPAITPRWLYLDLFNCVTLVEGSTRKGTGGALVVLFEGKGEYVLCQYRLLSAIQDGQDEARDLLRALLNGVMRY